MAQELVCQCRNKMIGLYESMLLNCMLEIVNDYPYT